LQDVRIVEALYQSAQTGKAVSVPAYEPREQPSGRQKIKRPGVAKRELVKVKSGSEE